MDNNSEAPKPIQTPEQAAQLARSGAVSSPLNEQPLTQPGQVIRRGFLGKIAAFFGVTAAAGAAGAALGERVGTGISQTINPSPETIDRRTNEEIKDSADTLYQQTSGNLSLDQKPFQPPPQPTPPTLSRPEQIPGVQKVNSLPVNNLPKTGSN